MHLENNNEIEDFYDDEIISPEFAQGNVKRRTVVGPWKNV